MTIPSVTATQLKVADAITGTITRILGEAGGAHAETAVASAARLAGTFLFRDFKFPARNIAPGSAVLSDAANEAAPLLFVTLEATLRALGVFTDPKKRSNFELAGHTSRLSVTDTQRLLESSIRTVIAGFELSSREAAQSCAIAAGRLIQLHASTLDPSVGAAVAAYGFIEGLKTMPPPLAGGTGRKSWYAFWR